METPRALLHKQISPIWWIPAYFVFVLFFVSLSGNFPLNDDWSWGEAVKTLLQTGHLIMPTVVAMGLTHVCLGAISCKIFGFSYVVLRAVMFSLGIIGSLALYRALRELSLHRNAAVFSALVYACNPLMVNLYFCYMSDVTALTLINIYIYLLLRSLKLNSINLALLSIVLLVLAVGARQSAVIFFPCNLALLSLKVRKPKLLYLMVLSSMVIPCLAYLGADQWLSHREFSVPDYLETKSGHLQFLSNLVHLPVSSLQNIITSTGETACYLSLFCLPVLLSLIFQCRQILSKYMRQVWYWLFASGCVVIISAFDLVYRQSRLMPFNQNLLRFPIVCALTIMGLNMHPLSNRTLGWITAISFFLAFVLLTVLGALIQILLVNVSKAIKDDPKAVQRLPIVWICVMSTFISTSFCIVETIVRGTDRYYLIALAPWLLSLALITSRLKLKIVRPASIVVLLLIAAYSACAAQDYLSWNRARWAGLERLEAMGVPADQIDGGFEYNTLRDITTYRSTNHGAPARSKWRWWGIKDEKYIVSFSPIPDYSVIDRIPYWSNLFLRKKEVLILQNNQSK